MKFFDDLVTLFTRRPRGRTATMSGSFIFDPLTGGTKETGVIHRIPLYVRVFRPGQSEPVALIPVANIAIQDYVPAKFDGGRLVSDEKEAGVYFDCIAPAKRGESVHVDKDGASNGNRDEEAKAESREAPLKRAGYKSEEWRVGV